MSESGYRTAKNALKLVAAASLLAACGESGSVSVTPREQTSSRAIVPLTEEPLPDVTYKSAEDLTILGQFLGSGICDVHVVVWNSADLEKAQKYAYIHGSPTDACPQPNVSVQIDCDPAHDGIVMHNIGYARIQYEADRTTCIATSSSN
jgi:hypothetical protein